MAVVMESLRPIYFQMQQLGIPQTRFSFRFGAASFTVFLRVEKTVLASLTFIKNSEFAVRFVVKPRFRVDTDISVSDYIALRRALGLELDPVAPFSLHTFLKAFELGVPASLPETQADPSRKSVFLAVPNATSPVGMRAGFGGVMASNERFISRRRTSQSS